MDVIGELIVRPVLSDHDIDNERTIIIEEIRSYLDDPSEYCQILFQGAMFGDGPLGREICGDEAGIRALPGTTSATSGGRPTGRPIPSSRWPATSPTTSSWTWRRVAFGTGNGPCPNFAPAPALPAGPRAKLGKRQTSQAQLWSGCRRCGATIPMRGPWRSSTPCSATG